EVQRFPHHDHLRALVGDERLERASPGRAVHPLDHGERPGDGSRRVAHRDAGARSTVVEGHDLQPACPRISSRAALTASGGPSGRLPPARARFGRPPPPPSTSGATPLMSASAERPASTAPLAKFATSIARPSVRAPSTTAAPSPRRSRRRSLAPRRASLSAASTSLTSALTGPMASAA